MNFPNVSPSQGLQFLTNCSTVAPFHGVQPFRNRLLQSGSPVGSQANLIQCVLLSPRVHRSWQEPAPARASHGVTASFGHPPALAWGPSWAAGGYLLYRGPPWAAEGQPASLWSSSWAAAESLLWHLDHVLPLLLHGPWCLQSCCSHIVSLLLPTAVAQGFFPLLKYVMLEVLPLLLMSSALASSRSVLEPVALALSDIGAASSSFSQKPPL